MDLEDKGQEIRTLHEYPVPGTVRRRRLARAMDSALSCPSPKLRPTKMVPQHPTAYWHLACCPFPDLTDKEVAMQKFISSLSYDPRRGVHGIAYRKNGRPHPGNARRPRLRPPLPANGLGLRRRSPQWLTAISRNPVGRRLDKRPRRPEA